MKNCIFDNFSNWKISETVGSVCNELGIPHIIAHWRPEETSNETEHHLYTRNMFPDNNVYSKALAQIVDDYEWKGFTLIYENKDSECVPSCAGNCHSVIRCL